MQAMEPRTDMHDVLRREAESYCVAIVTGRSEFSVPDLRLFVERHNLPVAEIIATSGGSKVPALTRLGSIRHYDDDDDVRLELGDSPVQFVLVAPGERRTA